MKNYYKLIVKVFTKIYSSLFSYIKMVCVFIISTIEKTFMNKKVPPLFMPSNLYKQYTQEGKVRARYFYMNNSYPSTKAIIYKKETINELIKKALEGRSFYYGETDQWLYQALKKYSIKDKSVAIMGSAEPVYESICIAYGGKPTTIEYNKIVSEDTRIQTMMVDEYDKNPIKFDAAFSISSFEHDGLGRYGDSLNPDGDILAMKKMKTILKTGAILILSVPIGKDTIVWNSHRIYGRIRLPRLLRMWELVDSFGFSEKLFLKKYCQPIFVLKNS